MLKSAIPKLQNHKNPVNKLASKDLWSYPERFTTKECPPLCSVPVSEIKKRNGYYRIKGRCYKGKFKDLTGQRLGKMVIIGLRIYRENRRSSWIAKCDCGNYEQRNHRNWSKYYKRSVPDACFECMDMKTRKELIKMIMDKKEKIGDNGER